MGMGITGNEVGAALGIALGLGVRKVRRNENEPELWTAEKQLVTIGLLIYMSIWRAEFWGQTSHEGV